MKMIKGIASSAGRRRLVAALVECAHEGGARVVSVGIERVSEFEAMRELAVDLGQGYYFGPSDGAPDGRRPAAGPAAAASWSRAR
jgi:EAL domain-containing protein (putative c-di-GMP-specific phosphodiesterase class I)